MLEINVPVKVIDTEKPKSVTPIITMREPVFNAYMDKLCTHDDSETLQGKLCLYTNDKASCVYSSLGILADCYVDAHMGKWEPHDGGGINVLSMGVSGKRYSDSIQDLSFAQWAGCSCASLSRLHGLSRDSVSVLELKHWLHRYVELTSAPSQSSLVEDAVSENQFGYISMSAIRDRLIQNVKTAYAYAYPVEPIQEAVFNPPAPKAKTRIYKVTAV